MNGLADDHSPPSIIAISVRKLRAAGKQVDTYLPENMPHGFYLGRPKGPEYLESTRRSIAFLKQEFQLAP